MGTSVLSRALSLMPRMTVASARARVLFFRGQYPGPPTTLLLISRKRHVPPWRFPFSGTPAECRGGFSRIYPVRLLGGSPAVRKKPLFARQDRLSLCPHRMGDRAHPPDRTRRNGM